MSPSPRIWTCREQARPWLSVDFVDFSFFARHCIGLAFLIPFGLGEMGIRIYTSSK